MRAELGLGCVAGARALRWLRAGAPERRLLPPAGARWSPPSSSAHARPVVGRIAAAAAAVRMPPVGGEPAVAYALWAWADGELTLCEAATLGFDLVTDDGRRIRVPAGRCRFAPVPAMPAALASEGMRSYASSRERRRDPDFPGIPVDRCAVEVLRPDQRVRVTARFERSPLPNPSIAVDYRTAAAELWTVRGVPMFSLS